MAIVCSDVHGNVKKLHNFLNYKPEVQHIFAGDAVDSYNEPYENQLKCLKELYESDCILLYGNHELSYHSLYRMSCSGRHYFGMDSFSQYIDNTDRWKLACVADGYLITHAGVSEKHAGSYKKIDNLAKRINKDLARRSNGIFDVGMCRGGSSVAGGPLWYDFRYDYVGLSKTFNQVFGHCSLQEPWEQKTEDYHWVCINSSDTLDDTWVFDTEKKKIVILK